LINRRLLTVKGSFPHVYITEKGRTALAASLTAKTSTIQSHSSAGGKGQPSQTESRHQVTDQIAPAAATRAGSAATIRPVSPEPGESRFLGLRLNIEMWKQGGSAPDPQKIVNALQSSAGATSGDLVVFLGAIAELGYRPALSLVQRILKEGSDPSLVAAACRAAGKLG